MPRKIRQLIKNLQDAGYVLAKQEGSHRKFKHAKKPDQVPAVKTLNLAQESKSAMLSRDYKLSVEWSDEDRAYVGYCRELFPYAGVCHDENRIAAYAKLVEVVEVAPRR